MRPTYPREHTAGGPPQERAAPELRLQTMTELRITGLASGTVGWSELGDIADAAEGAGGLLDGIVGAAVPVASVVERFPIEIGRASCRERV